MTVEKALECAPAERLETFASPPAFVLATARETVVAAGQRHVVPPEAGWAEQFRAFVRGLDRSGPPVLVGALPFQSGRRPHLYQPEAFTRTPSDEADAGPRSAAQPRPATWHVVACPPRAEYERNVARALAMLEPADAGPEALRKVVVARSLLLEADAALNVGALLERLRSDSSVTVFAVPLPPRQPGVPRTLIGATPELLVDKTGSTVVSEPLAGSAPRSRDRAADRESAELLLQSRKDRREHAMVVEWIADRLTPYCRRLHVPREPSLVSTRFVWHLATRVEGELCDPDVSSLELLESLHPTPAICGSPPGAARAAISVLEPFDREFFGGAVGWCDAGGDGRWYMSIRCADISGPVARLYAGAGIVAGSDPATEGGETSAKLAALLDALGVDEDGQLRAGSLL